MENLDPVDKHQKNKKRVLAGTPPFKESGNSVVVFVFGFCVSF